MALTLLILGLIGGSLVDDVDVAVLDTDLDIVVVYIVDNLSGVGNLTLGPTYRCTSRSNSVMSRAASSRCKCSGMAILPDPILNAVVVVELALGVGSAFEADELFLDSFVLISFLDDVDKLDGDRQTLELSPFVMLMSISIIVN